MQPPPTQHKAYDKFSNNSKNKQMSNKNKNLPNNKLESEDDSTNNQL